MPTWELYHISAAPWFLHGRPLANFQPGTYSAFRAHGSQIGNPIGVVLLQVRWMMTPQRCWGPSTWLLWPKEKERQTLLSFCSVETTEGFLGDPQWKVALPVQVAALECPTRAGSALAVPPIDWGQLGRKLKSTMP